MTYLGLLAAVIGGSYLISQRGNLGKVAQQASIWGLIFVGVIAAVGMWGDISRTVTPRQAVISESQIVVPQAPDGHYYLTVEINGAPIPFVVDTGATQVVLTQADARRAGLDPASLRYLGQANTANGVVRTAPVWLDTVELGPFQDSRVRASVNAGEMQGSLLGMSYLNLFDSLEFRSGELILSR